MDDPNLSDSQTIHSPHQNGQDQVVSVPPTFRSHHLGWAVRRPTASSLLSVVSDSAINNSLLLSVCISLFQSWVKGLTRPPCRKYQPTSLVHQWVIWLICWCYMLIGWYCSAALQQLSYLALTQAKSVRYVPQWDTQDGWCIQSAWPTSKT